MWLDDHIVSFFGAVCDSRYIKDKHILKQQQEFAVNNKISNETFANVFDRGYQLTLFAHQHGKHPILQPHFEEKTVSLTQKKSWVQPKLLL
jgi:hypothetical protein